MTSKTQWTEKRGYNNPDVTTEPLRSWFHEMIKTFPPMNGPLASRDFDNPNLTDYCVGQTVIYCAFAWSQAETAYESIKRLAEKHQVGFFDVSSNDADIWLPTPDGGLATSNE